MLAWFHNGTTSLLAVKALAVNRPLENQAAPHEYLVPPPPAPPRPRPLGPSKNPIKGNPVFSRPLYFRQTALVLRSLDIEILTARVECCAIRLVSYV